MTCDKIQWWWFLMLQYHESQSLLRGFPNKIYYFTQMVLEFLKKDKLHNLVIKYIITYTILLHKHAFSVIYFVYRRVKCSFPFAFYHHATNIYVCMPSIKTKYLKHSGTNYMLKSSNDDQWFARNYKSCTCTFVQQILSSYQTTLAPI